MGGTKRNNTWQRVLSLVLSVSMIACMIPQPALAEALSEQAASGASRVETTTAAADEAVSGAPSPSDGTVTDADSSPSASADAGALVDETQPADQGGNAANGDVTDAAETSPGVVMTPQSTVNAIDACSIVNADGSSVTSVGVDGIVKVYAATTDEWDVDTELTDEEYSSISYQWFAGTTEVTYAESGSAFDSYAAIPGATSRLYEVTSDQVGKCLACRVTYGSDSTIWTSSSTPAATDGKEALSGVSISGKAKVGNTLTATATSNEGDEVSSGVTYQWRSADAADGTYADIPGATSPTLATDDLSGRYVEVVASSRNVVTSSAFGPIAAQGSQANEARLAAAVLALQNDTETSYSGWYPDPSYGTDANVDAMLDARLAALGYGDVSGRVSSVSWPSPADPAQSGAIDTSSGSSNGDVTFFFLAPAEKTVASDYSSLRQFTATFRLTCGDATDDFVPGRASTLGWDEGKVASYLEAQAASAALPASVVSGTAAEPVASEALPSSVTSGTTKTASVAWASSNDSVSKVTSGYDYSTWEAVTSVKYVHAAVPLSATLTATYSLNVSGYGNDPKTTVTKDYPVVVAEKSAATVLQVREQLANLIAKATAVDFNTGSAIDATAVSSDLQFSTTRDLGIDGKVYQLSYVTSDSGAIAVNGYHGVVTRPLAGEAERQATITAKLTYDGVTVTKDLGPFTLTSVDDAEIDQAVSLMEQVKAGYSAALLGTNASASAVSSGLDPFMEVSADENGGLAWARSVRDETGDGIIADDIAGYDPMGSQGWRTFKSSRPDVLSHETLRLTQPTYNTQVTVSSSLTYERYRSLAAAHPDNAKLQSLVNQDVSATFTAQGTTGQDDPNAGKSFATTVRVIGPDASGKDAEWASETYRATAGQSAADSSLAVFGEAGLAYTYSGGYLSDIISPYTGANYARDATTGRYWQLFVNGEVSDVGAASRYLKAGDSIVWYYSAYGDTLSDIGKNRVSVAVIGPDAGGVDSYWESPTAERTISTENAWDVVKRAFTARGLTCDATEGTAYGTMLNTITSPFTGKPLGYDAATGKYWQLFVNGVSSSVGISSVELKDGDKVVWKYSAWGDTSGTTVGTVVYDSPTTELPTYEADWPETETGGNVTTAVTPTVWATALWSTLVGGGSATSAPLIAGGKVYVAVGSGFMSGSSGSVYSNKLVRVDVTTGAVEATGQLAGSISYTSRPLYADGMVFVALADGSVQALNAKTMCTRWVSNSLPETSNSQSAIRCEGGVVYVEASSSVDSNGRATSGSVIALDEMTGEVKWQADNPTSGYNWTGAVSSGSVAIVGDTEGTIHAFDSTTGAEVSSLSIGSSPVNADPVSYDGKLLVVTRDGTLHVVTAGADGALSETASLKVLGGCKAAPTVVGTKAIIVGASTDGTSSALVVVDLASMSVERIVTKADGALLALGLGGISAPALVSTQASGTYCYFALNDAVPTDKTCTTFSTGGDVFVYRLGDDQASLFYLPTGANAQYCDYQLICDASGNLYYLNDSGYLVRLKAADKPGSPQVQTDGGSSASASGSVSTASVSTSSTVSLSGNATRAGISSASTETDQRSGLLAGFSSDQTTGGQLLSSAADASTADETPAGHALPIWPMVGMGIGCAALLAAVLWRRRAKGEVA